ILRHETDLARFANLSMSLKLPSMPEDGSFTHFNERHKEAWICDGYDYRDTRDDSNEVEHAVREILQRAAEAICSPLNGIMCRWEPPGKGEGGYLPDLSSAKGSGRLGAELVKRYPEGDIAMVQAGLLVALGGPLREKWLYSQPRDEEHPIMTYPETTQPLN
ncbi:SLC35E2B, partial [Symbiodinium necroappetens]